jgi:PAS domain S-box-containing protein
MNNPSPKSVPAPSDAEVSRWVRQLREAETRLRELLGDRAETVLGAGAESALLRNVRQQLVTNEAESSRSKVEFRDAQRMARFGSWELDLANLEDVDANPLRWSEEVFRILGYEPGEIEVSNTNFFCAVHPEDRASVQRAVRQAIRAGTPYAIDHRIVLPHGAIRFVHEEAHTLKDPASGRALKMVGIIQDITEQKEKEEALRISEERFAHAFEYAPIGMALVAPDGSWLKVNQALCRLVGYEADELLDLSFQDITHEEDLATDLDYVRQTLAGKISHYQMEKRYFHKQGHLVWVLLSVSLVRDLEGIPLYFVSQIQDITQRKVSEQKLAEQAALIDEARDAIILRDMEHKVLFWNKGAERLYGWTSAEMLGQKSTKFYLNLEKFDLALQSVLQKGGWIGELEHITKQGIPTTVESRWNLLRDAEGRPKSVLCINTDITERKKIEAHLLRAQRMESIGTLASGIAHDLNNLLSPIIMGVELLKHFGVDEPVRKVVADIERSALRGSNLVKQVLAFARGVEGARVALDVRGIVHELESIIQNTFPKHLTITTRLPEEPLIIKGDPTQLNQVLLNLCVNSRDAMPLCGFLTLSARSVQLDATHRVMQPGIAPGPFVCLEVSDTGYGIPPEHLEKIFDPFFTTKELTKGTGLGLSTTLGIVRSHGGFIHVESKPGEGTTFQVYLPARTASLEAQEEEPTRTEYPRGQGEWILVVEDEPSILTVTRQILETFDYQVLAAEDGAQAISVFTAHRDKIALVMTDMMMPVLDGPATIAFLREIDPRVKIIATSGLNTPHNAAQLGVKHFLSKPYSTGTLLNLVQSALKKEG